MQPQRRTEALGWGLALVLVAAAMLWPAVLNGRPAYYFDSAGYFTNGRAAVSAVQAKFERILPHKASTARLGTGEGEKSAKDVGSTRAVAYAVFAFLTSWPDGRMVGTIVVQALLLAGVLLIWWRRAAPGIGWPAALGASLVLAAVSQAPWFTSFAMPDIFAGTGVLAFLAMALPSARPLSLVSRVFLVLVAALAFAAHTSHIPLLAAVSCLAMGLVVFKAWRNATAPDLREIGWLAAPVILGMAVVLTTSMIGFAQVSLAPKRLPLVLARSIADGPARWYLEKHCASEHYTVCQVFPVLPKNHAEFLFGPNGLRARATPAQMDAIRSEETEIVRRAAREYPLQQAAISARNFFRQVFAWGLWDIDFRRELQLDANGTLVMRHVDETNNARRVFIAASTALVLVAVVYLTAMVRRLRPGELAVLALAITAVLINAAVTGVLSSVANRYGGRLIWVLPAIAIAFWLARRWPAVKPASEPIDEAPLAQSETPSLVDADRA
jgi:hypothetical protein